MKTIQDFEYRYREILTDDDGTESVYYRDVDGNLWDEDEYLCREREEVAEHFGGWPRYEVVGFCPDGLSEKELMNWIYLREKEDV